MKDQTNLVNRPVESHEFLSPLVFVENRLLKRIFDIVFSLLFLTLVFPVFYIIIGICIKISSKGPILFKQKRIGINNQEFLCYKFRTMRADNKDEVRQATKNDNRVTTIGSILRKTSLDELPQFINVLLGNMSIVGPRPMMTQHTEAYAQQLERFTERQLITPGITGHAQINGFRGEVTSHNHIDQRVEYDRWYIRNWNPTLDLKIIFLTVVHIFQGEENAY